MCLLYTASTVVLAVFACDIALQIQAAVHHQCYYSPLMSCRALVPSVPLRLSVMRAGRSTAAAATPRELVCLAWGLTASGVAFTATFTDKLLTAVTAKKSELRGGLFVAFHTVFCSTQLWLSPVQHAPDTQQQQIGGNRLALVASTLVSGEVLP